MPVELIHPGNILICSSCFTRVARCLSDMIALISTGLQLELCADLVTCHKSIMQK